MRVRAAVTATVLGMVGLAGACPGPPQPVGYTMSTFFPMDGERTWTYTKTPSGNDPEIVATLDPNIDRIEGGSTQVRTIDYAWHCGPTTEGTGCEEFVFRSVDISSNENSGTRVHSVWTPEDGDIVFDPPLALTAATMLAGDRIVTETRGKTWTALFEQLGDCPQQYNPNWRDCLRLHVDDGGEGEFPAGQWWAIPSFNIVAFVEGAAPAGSHAPSAGFPRWELLKQTWVR